jgi:DNA invertase Pin-like site-specific DNA recombinase
VNTQAVALYLRVSTEDQDLAGQRRELEAEAARRGWTIAEIYEEKVSGTGKVERREYDRLLKEARVPDRPWSHLLVWSLDRFSREERFTKAIDAILDLEKGGVTFHSLKEPYLDTPTGAAGAFDVRGLLLSVTSLVAGFESRRRSERVRVAMRELKEGRRQTRSGRPVGRPRAVTIQLARKAESLRAEGKSWAVVAQSVGLKSETCRRAVLDLRRTTPRG